MCANKFQKNIFIKIAGKDTFLKFLRLKNNTGPLRKKQELSLTCRLLSSTYSFFFGFSSWSRVIIWVLFPVMFWLFLVNASKKLEIANWIFCFLQRSPLIRRRKGRKIWSEQGGFYDALSRNELANIELTGKFNGKQ